MLEIRLLGRFDLQADGEPIEIPSRPAQSLLAYLILSPGVQHRREKLAGMLWPDSDEASARNNLRHALWRARKAVGERYLLADKVSVSFNPEAEFRLDVKALERSPEGQSTTELVEAVAGYAGELLPGFYEEWVLLERERVQAVFESRMQVLLTRLMEEARWRDVLAWGERWISLGGIPEPAYRALMRAHSAVGDLASVAAVYKRCVAVFEDELGVEPSDETHALYLQLTGPDRPPGAEASASLLREPRVNLRDAAAPPPTFLEAEGAEGAQNAGHFVGRERMLARLQRFLDLALEGRGQIVFVTGESGQGKTSLVMEFARRAQAAQSELLLAVGQCNVHTGIGDPYLPFREVLGMLSGDLEGQWASGALNRSQAMRLWTNVPSAVTALLDYGPDLVDSLIPARSLAARLLSKGNGSTPLIDRLETLASRNASLTAEPGIHPHRIFEEYTDVLERLAASNPLMIFLDDLHWVDASSANLLFHLGRRILDSRILIVGAYRPEDLISSGRAEDHPLQTVLSELKRQAGDILVDLDPGDAGGGRGFIDALLDAEPNHLGGTFRRRLASITGGQPLFTCELVQEMQQRGDIVRDAEGFWVEAPDLAWDLIPAKVEAVIEKRLNRLEPKLRRALEVASVEGETFTAEAVAQVLGMEGQDVVGWLSGELERQHGLVAELGLHTIGAQRLSQYRFHHSFIQHYLYGLLHESERHYLHEAVGLALEDLYGDEANEIAVHLARHFMEADMPEKAVRYLDHVGSRALEVSANKEAVVQLGKAMELLEDLTDGPEAAPAVAPTLLERARLERRLGEAYYGLGDLSRCRTHLEHALAVLGRPFPETRRSLAVGLIGQMGLQGARRLFARAIAARPRASRPELVEAAHILKVLAEVHLAANDNLSTLFAALRGLNLAEAAGPSAELAMAYGDMAAAAPLLRLSALAERYRRLALKTAERVDQLPLTAYVLHATSVYTAGEGRWAESIEALERANGIYETLGNWNRLGIGLILLANCYNFRGEFERARELCLDVSRLAERSGSVQQETWGLDGRAEAYLWMGGAGEAQRALELLKEARALIQRGPFEQEDVVNSALTAVAHARRQEWEQARRAAEDASDLIGGSTPNFFSLFAGYAGAAAAFLTLLESETGLQDHAGLLARARQACQDLRRFSAIFPIGRPRAEISEGQYDSLIGSRSRASRHFKAGLALARQFQMPFEEALAHYRLGLMGEGGAEASAGHLGQAAELFGRLHAQYEHEAAASALQRLNGGSEGAPSDRTALES